MHNRMLPESALANIRRLASSGGPKDTARGIPAQAFETGGAFDAAQSRRSAKDADPEPMPDVDNLDPDHGVDEISAWVGRRLTPELRDQLVEKLQAIDFEESARQQASNNLPSGAEDARRRMHPLGQELLKNSGGRYAQDHRLRRPTDQNRADFAERYPDIARMK